ncbi:MAG: CHAT domain-containing protein, partial [Acidobacteria bacterium]|nr:CHAT domain-containing protein [Acidobacteriota bacterium]
YTNSPLAPFADWQAIRGKRCLLVIHGILSSVEGMLTRLPKASLERWCTAYEGRVLGFNHHSITMSPEENARFFLSSIKAALPNDSLDIDIVCHSRGGIVARTLVERGAELLPELNCRFGKVFFVATPNQGSALGNAEHLVDMVDVFTNFLTNFPDGPVLYSVEVLLGIVKLLALTAGSHLTGVESMATNGYISTVLNAGRAPNPAAYAAAASNYTPAPGTDNAYLLWRFADTVLDRVFRDGGQPVANDLVVPSDGVWQANGHPSFPIRDPLLFTGKDGVWHSGFFARAETTQAIERHLGVPSEPLVVSPETVAVPPIRPRRLRGGGGAPVMAEKSGGDTVQREPEITFHEQVLEGETWPLEVELRESASAAALQLLFAPGAEELTLSAEISAPGFQVVGQRHVALVVNRVRRPETEKAVFTLTALHPGPQPATQEIIVTFWQDNSALGTVTHRTVVVPKDYAKDAPWGGQSKTHTLRISPRRRESPDVVVYLRKLGGRDEAYDLSIRSVVEAAEYEDQPFGTFALDGSNMATYFSQAIDPIFRAFPSGQMSDAEFDAELAKWNGRLLSDLQDLGARLWLMLPAAFRSEYLRLMNLPNPPRSICIHSEEMIFPWELVQPSGTVDGSYRRLPALGVSHILGRWKVGLEARPQPQAISAPRVAILNPRYTEDELPWSEDERTAIQKMLPGVEVITPVTRSSINQLLARADLHLVHFTGHGDWDDTVNADLSALRLEGGDSIKAIGFASSRLGAEGRPILCLNACTIGRVSQVIGRPGGFAANCLESGWSGVIAPYWPVYDPKAYEFSLQLYEKLRFGRSIGEALQEIRREHQEDPTALSYSYFGDPFARLLFA